MNTKHQLIINKSGLKVFDTFNEDLSRIAISICNLLTKFQIYALSVNDSKHIEDIGMKDSDPMACYINKTEYDASSTYAEIVINEEKCEKMILSEEEMLAAIAHEVGHIIFYFLDGKENKRDMEEVICDNYACRMGLGKPLASVLDKLINLGGYSQEHELLLLNRKRFILAFNS